MQVTTKVKEFKIFLRDKTIITTTAEDARRIRDERNKQGSRLIDIRDEFGNYEYSVDKNDIIRMEKIKPKQKEQGMGHYCDYGTFHEEGTTKNGWCCQKHFKGMNPFSFFKLIKFGLNHYNLYYGRQITSAYKQEALHWMEENNYDPKSHTLSFTPIRYTIENPRKEGDPEYKATLKLKTEHRRPLLKTI